MGLDVCRYIEIKTYDYTGVVYNESEINHIGHFKEGDILLIFNSYNGYNYWKISAILNSNSENEKIIYEPYENNSLSILNNIDIVYRCEFYKDLPSKQLPLYEGCIYKYFDSHATKYKQYIHGNWITLDSCPSSWKALKWKNTKNCIYTYCNDFIYEYIYCDKTNKNMPDDITDYVKNEIKDSIAVSYITLSDLYNIYNKIHDSIKLLFSNQIILRQNNIILDRLDYIIKNMIDNSVELPNTDYDEESLDSEFDDKLYNSENAYSEYHLINNIIDMYYDEGIAEKNVRIIYCFYN